MEAALEGFLPKQKVEQKEDKKAESQTAVKPTEKPVPKTGFLGMLLQRAGKWIDSQVPEKYQRKWAVEDEIEKKRIRNTLKEIARKEQNAKTPRVRVSAPATSSAALK